MNSYGISMTPVILAPDNYIVQFHKKLGYETQGRNSGNEENMRNKLNLIS